MCLAIPGEVTAVNGVEAQAEFWDVEKTVRLDIVGDTVEEGDYILNHAGFAIRRIPDDQVEATIETYEAFLDGDEDEALDELGAEDADLGLATPAPDTGGRAAEHRETSSLASESGLDAATETDAEHDSNAGREHNGD